MKRLTSLGLLIMLAFASEAGAQSEARTKFGKVGISSNAADALCVGDNADAPAASVCDGGIYAGPIVATSATIPTLLGPVTANGAWTFSAAGTAVSVTNTLSAGLFSGSGASLTSLNATNVSSGTLDVQRGGTGFGSYTIGDILYASGVTTIGRLAAVASGQLLVSQGVGIAPGYSDKLVVSGAGPHAIGVATVVNHQILVGGGYAPAANHVRGLEIEPTLTPNATGGTLYGLQVVPTFVLPAGTTTIEAASTRFLPPGFSGTGAVTDAATVIIDGAPASGTTKRSLWVKAGSSLFGGSVSMANNIGLHGLTTDGASRQLILMNASNQVTLAGDGDVITFGGSGGTEKMTIDATALLMGIGAAGAARLSVNTTNPVFATSGDTDTGMGRSAADEWSVYTAGVQRAKWDASGNFTQIGGQILTADGSATAPTYSFSSGTSTGLFRSTSGIGHAVAGTEYMRLNSSGRLRLGSGIVGDTGGDILKVDAQGLDFPATFNTGTDGTIINFNAQGTTEGSISVSGATVTYGTFTGSHYTQLKTGQSEPSQGTVVVSLGELVPMRPERVASSRKRKGPDAIDREKIVYVALSSRRNQRGVYGVWFGKLADRAEHMSWGDPNKPVYQVAAIGLYYVRVTDSCGDIRNGDFLATSPRAGFAERQCTADGLAYDGVFRDSTLGKALVDVNWLLIEPDADGVKRTVIPATLHAG